MLRRVSWSRYIQLVDNAMSDFSDKLGRPPRAAWMRILALAEPEDLATCATPLIDVPYDLLRAPETGLVMLRGRMGATGSAFNLGEATVTRCVVRLADGLEGHAYVLGRNAAHARMAALCDALLQDEAQAGVLCDQVIVPLAHKLQTKRQVDAGKAAATKVDFFTLVRGDD